MEKKYRLTDETIKFGGVELHRIEALRDFWRVKKGDKGGFVQSEKNLSHDGDCWIFNDAKVYSNAKVSGSATVSQNAIVSEEATVYENAIVRGSSVVRGLAIVRGSSIVNDFAIVHGSSIVEGHSIVSEEAVVSGKSIVREFSTVLGHASIFNAKIERSSDYIVFQNWWSSLRHFTWLKSNNMWSVGCFYGTGEELIKKAYNDGEISGREYKRVVDYVESILRDEKLKNN